jgi:3-methyladenine DNA glycosylase AlkD
MSPTATAVRPISTKDDTPPVSEATTHAVAFVAERRGPAEAAGRDLAALVGDPEAFAAAIRRTFEDLADPMYLAGQRHVAPGIGELHGVRWPLNAAVIRGFRAATRGERPVGWLEVADRLFGEPTLEERWFAFGLLERLLPYDPERSWQLLRRASREAADWITVDTLAHPYGRGILAEPYRWAELEQLMYSPSRWERRLVGSTIATLPHLGKAGRDPSIAAHGLPLLGQLIGDVEPDVQKALAWAVRELVKVDRAAVTAFCSAEADRAAATADGHRAWVVRDALSKLDPETASSLRERLAGIRRRPGAPSTSAAAEASAAFAGPGALPDPRDHPDVPFWTLDRETGDR